MLESLLADVLTRVLGQYLRGIDRDNVNFGVWGGCLELRGLALRPESLAVLFETLGMELPVTVNAGFIGLLRIVVPWQSLGSTPATIYMENLTIIAGPVRGDSSATSDLQVREQRLKRAKLATDDAVREAAWAVQAGRGENTAAESSGWASRLIAKVIENMQVELADIVIRFEDGVSNKAKPYVIALMCESIKAVTVDEKWKEAYIHTASEAAVTRKSITVKGLQLKWGSMDSLFASGYTKNPLAKEDSRDGTPSGTDISRGVVSGESAVEAVCVSSSEELRRSSSKGSSLKCIVPPFAGYMKASLTKSAVQAVGTVAAEDASSAVELDLQFPDLVVELDDEQYSSVMQTSVYFARLSSRGFRPNTPRDWWMWSIEQILPGFRERLAARKCLTLAGLRRRSSERQLYVATRIALLKARRTGGSEAVSSELEKMENEMSYDDIVLYRDLADDNIASVSKDWHLSSSATQESSTGTTASVFWSLLGYSTSGVTTDGSDTNATAVAGVEARGSTQENESCVPALRAEGSNAAVIDSEQGKESRNSLMNKAGETANLVRRLPKFRAGFLMQNGKLRMLRGGHPNSAEPMLEVVWRDLQVGISTFEDKTFVLEAVLGTLEALDLRSNSKIVYPRVPWSPKRRRASCASRQQTYDSSFDMLKCGEEERVTHRSEGVGDGDVSVDARSMSLSYAPHATEDDFGTDPYSLDACGGESIPGSSYPTNVQAALHAIRNAADSSCAGVRRTSRHESPRVGLALATEMDAVAIQGHHLTNDDSTRLDGGEERISGFTVARDDSIDDENGGDVSPAEDTRDTGDVSARVAQDAATSWSSLRISQGEFFGLSASGAEVESLEYLVAIRVQAKTSAFGDVFAGNGDNAESAQHSSRIAIDAAVGRLEAIVDGPAGSFLWGMRFWKPKGKLDDPIMSFLDASAGARVAELRMELENALLTRHSPISINAKICGPRFIIPGRFRDSPTVVANMGTLGIFSRGLRQKPEQKSGEQYSEYHVSLDNLGVYLAPSLTTATSRKSMTAEVDNAYAELGESEGYGFGRAEARVDTDGVERIVRPVSVALAVSVLQDAHVVGLARRSRIDGGDLHREESSNASSIAKVSVRGRLPSASIVLSQGATQCLLVILKHWGRELARMSAREARMARGAECLEPQGATSASSRSPSPRLAPLVSGTSPGLRPISSSSFTLAVFDAKLDVETMSLELRDKTGRRIVQAVAAGTRVRIIQTDVNEIAADFRLHSWTVTDGSRGATAVFRHLAHAGASTQERGVSPPHSSGLSTSGRSESSVADQDSFVRIRFRQNFATRERSMSVRFLSLDMVCVRETYVRIAAFLYGVLRELKRLRKAEKEAIGPELSLTGPSSASHFESVVEDGSQKDGIKPRVSGDLGGSDGVTDGGRFVVTAALDGFRLQLASEEGALICVEMKDCNVRLERSVEKAFEGSGSVGFFAIRDLTAPLPVHVNTVMYERRGKADGMSTPTGGNSQAKNGSFCADESENNVVLDSWSVTIPPVGKTGPVVLRAKITGLRILFLRRFTAVLSRYVALLRKGLQPALDEVRAAVDGVESLSTTKHTPVDPAAGGLSLEI